MAFGIPNSGDLSALADKIGAIVASVGPEEAVVIKDAIQQLSDHANAMEDKGIAAGSALVAQINEALTQQQVAFFTALDARLPLKMTAQLGYAGPQFPPQKT